MAVALQRSNVRWRETKTPPPRRRGTKIARRFNTGEGDATFSVSPVGTIEAFRHRPNHKGKGINILFVDGHTAFLSKDELIASLRQMEDNEKLPAPNRDSIRKALTEVLAEGPVKRKSP